MRNLATQFDGIGEVNGYRFNQVEASENGYIYSVTCKETGKVHYEVFKKKANRRFNVVSYPTSKSFGLWAWTCMDLEKAQARLKNFEKDLEEQKV